MGGDLSVSGDIRPPLTQIPPHIQSLADYEALAQHHLPTATWQHIQSGAGLEESLADNRRIFRDYQFIPRVCTDMEGASSAITLLGQSYSTPLMLAPVAYHRLAHGDGEIATMRAATALGVPMIVSTLSSINLEAIAEAARETAKALGRPAPPPLWFQLYLQPEPAQSEALVRRAEAAGYQHIVLTVDAAIKPSRFTLPAGVEAANLRGLTRPLHSSEANDGHMLLGSDLLRSAPTWQSVKWLSSVTSLPIWVKGILSPQDAIMAMECGADGVILSNHGGRVLDGLISPLCILPDVRAQLGTATPILIDSGFRTGGDIAKALALGADAVLIGRPQLHALAVAGMAGCAHMLQILRAELEHVMAQLGCKTPKDLGPQHLRCRKG
jgi:4-hydroxymandelate oxidase